MEDTLSYIFLSVVSMGVADALIFGTFGLDAAMGHAHGPHLH